MVVNERMAVVKQKTDGQTEDEGGQTEDAGGQKEVRRRCSNRKRASMAMVK